MHGCRMIYVLLNQTIFISPFTYLNFSVYPSKEQNLVPILINVIRTFSKPHVSIGNFKSRYNLLLTREPLNPVVWPRCASTYAGS